MTKLTLIISLLVLPLVANGEVASKTLRGSNPIKHVSMNSTSNCLPCNVLAGDVQFWKGYYSAEHGDFLVCEPDAADEPTGTASMVYKLDDLPTDFHQQYKYQLENGKSRICIPNAKLNKTSHKVHIPKDAKPKYLGERDDHKRNHHRELSTPLGKHSVLVVIVSSTFNESDPTINTSIIARNFFGLGSTPPVTVASQYNACSNGNMTLVPATGNGVVDGVLNVKISTKVSGTSTTTIENAAVTATLSALKISAIGSAATHVLFCLPPGSIYGSTGWVSYGYVNAVKSVHNAGSCAMLTVPMHEIGHNIGFQHSGNGTNGYEYGDNSGVMGGAVRQWNSTFPQMCFNSQKNYASGWFKGRTISVNPVNGAWGGLLIPPVDYSAAAGTLPGAYAVVNVGKLFFQLNSAKRYNYETVSFPNQVVVVASDATITLKSWIVGSGLKATQSYTYANFTGSTSLTITVCNITFGDIDTAYASIHLNDGIQQPLC